MITPTKRKRAQRKGREHIHILLYRQGMKCYWCDIPIFHEDYFSCSEILNISDSKISFLYGDSVQRATIDHVVRLCDGGYTHLKNLVASCRACNTERHHGQTNEYQLLINRGWIQWPDGLDVLWQHPVTKRLYSYVAASHYGRLKKPEDYFI